MRAKSPSATQMQDRLRRQSATSGSAAPAKELRKLADEVRQIAGQMEEQFRALEKRSQSNAALMTPAALEHAIQVAFSSTLRKVSNARERQVAGLMEQQLRFQHELSQTHEMLARNRQLLEALADKLLGTPNQRNSDPRRRAKPTPGAHSEGLQSGPLDSTEPSAAAERRWQMRLAQGEALRAEWVKDKLLVPAVDFARRWGRTRQALDQACERGELFSLKIGKNRYYPATFLNLEGEAVKRVNLALKGDDVAAKFLFWQETFGALGGKSIAEAVAAGKVDRAVELALGWSEEHGFANASAT